MLLLAFATIIVILKNTTTKVSNDIDSNVGSPDLPANNVASVFRTFLNSRKVCFFLEMLFYLFIFQFNRKI